MAIYLYNSYIHEAKKSVAWIQFLYKMHYESTDRAWCYLFHLLTAIQALVCLKQQVLISCTQGYDTAILTGFSWSDKVLFLH